MMKRDCIEVIKQAMAVLQEIRDTTPIVMQRKLADTALLAALPDAIRELEWQPIETAPKDGTPILAYNPLGRMVGAGLHIAWWSSDDAGDEYGCWHNSRGAIGYLSRFTGKTEGALTHWMPLPQPPATERGEDE